MLFISSKHAYFHSFSRLSWENGYIKLPGRDLGSGRAGGFVIDSISLFAVSLHTHLQKSMRSIWKQYFNEAHGVIFVIDAADRARFPEAKAALGAFELNVALNHEFQLLCNRRNAGR